MGGTGHPGGVRCGAVRRARRAGAAVAAVSRRRVPQRARDAHRLPSGHERGRPAPPAQAPHRHRLAASRPARFPSSPTSRRTWPRPTACTSPGTATPPRWSRSRARGCCSTRCGATAARRRGWSARAGCTSRRSPLDELPALDAMVISHDHYDHLDMATDQALAASRSAPFLVPLGVGAPPGALGRAGGPDHRAGLGRGRDRRRARAHRHRRPGTSPAASFNRDYTLWSSGSIAGPTHRRSSTPATPATSTASPRSAREHGPFDATLMQIGAYGERLAGHPHDARGRRRGPPRRPRRPA